MFDSADFALRAYLIRKIFAESGLMMADEMAISEIARLKKQMQSEAREDSRRGSKGLKQLDARQNHHAKENGHAQA